MRRRFLEWMEATNGLAIGAVLDAGLAVVLAAVVTASLRCLIEFL